MTTKDLAGNPVPHLSPARRIIRSVVKICFVLVIMDGILFGAAGRIDWPGAWALSLVIFLLLMVIAIWGSLKAPELLEERSKTADNVKPWDKVIMRLYRFVLFTLMVTAGLDAGRFGWSAVPLALQAAGGVVVIAAGVVMWRCMAANAYLSSWARIQDDRGHKVVDRGPYRYVRHPMYISLIVMFGGVALALGSWWALIPAGIIATLFVLRTALEDRMLLNELEGYRDYSSRVRARLLPGVW